jgi:hypothetical protein
MRTGQTRVQVAAQSRDGVVAGLFRLLLILKFRGSIYPFGSHAARFSDKGQPVWISTAKFQGEYECHKNL